MTQSTCLTSIGENDRERGRKTEYAKFKSAIPVLVYKIIFGRHPLHSVCMHLHCGMCRHIVCGMEVCKCNARS